MQQLILFLLVAIAAGASAHRECIAVEPKLPVGESGDAIRAYIDHIPLTTTPLSVEDINLSLHLQYRMSTLESAEWKTANSRLLGYFEGLSRTDLPEWWERRMLSGQNIQGQVSFPSAEAEQGESLWVEHGQCWISGIDRVTMRDEGVLIAQKDDEYLLSNEILARVFGNGIRFQDEPQPLAVGMSGKHVAVFRNYSLICVDRVSSKALWIHDFQENLGEAAMTGPDDIYYEVVISNGRVCAFSACNYGMKCIVADENTGNILLRFNTQYVRSPSQGRVARPNESISTENE